MKKSLKKQNIIQLIVALAIVMLVNYISSNTYFRLDLTADKRYTLSDATHEILDSLEDVIYIEIYLDGEMPIGFQRMQKSIHELMDEFRVIAGNNIQFQFVNPSQSSDQSKRNAIYQDLYERGLDPTNVKDRDEEGGLAEKILFPGAIMTFQEKETPINLLVNNPTLSADENLNNSIQSLEYMFIDAIRKITTKQRQRIAFIEGQGELDEFYTGDITNALNEYYDIDRVTIKDYVNILNPYDAIIIAGPTEQYTEKSKFIIDQYMMNGGKVLWFIESVKISMDSISNGQASFALINDVNLNDQLFKYGVRVNPNVIEDIQCAVIPINTAIAGAQAKFAPAPWLYFPLLVSSNNNPITKNLNMIKSEFPSVIDFVGDSQEVKKEVILSSSYNSKVLNVPLLVSLAQVREMPDPQTFNSPNNPVAVSLEGIFESVFQNRIIKDYTSGLEFDFKDRSEPTKMIVVSDADIIRNDVKQRADGIFISPLGYDRFTKQTYGNKAFVMNAVHYLIDESGILDMRSREFKLRILDKQKVLKEKVRWQLINTVLPIVFILIFAIVIAYLRKRKYT
ncbi:MAG TPA: gliding motility-associated ABC transporter substrate-binding protein GldG [Bacteroidales bacterium]|nr:gliding motility-associated ABC transporter substrate-binding protein GldG [Bacteroidales bacterium]